MPPKRSRDPLDDPKGPKIRGLSWTGQQPSFLRNAAAALSGRPSGSPSSLEANGRPAIPTRPGGGSEGEDSEGEEEEDEWGLGGGRGGDEAPQVVVLKDGKHLGVEEVERLRAEAKSSGTSDPLHTADSSAANAKSKGSLSFSSGTASSTKSRPGGTGGGNGDWADVLAGASAGSGKKTGEEGKGAAVEPAQPPPPPVKKLSKEEKEKLRVKEEKKKAKEKKVNKQKIAKLSFDDE
ncbi:hypothetical protein JCM8547_009172 [Rhodosporidiobolus lusitaniae]